MNIKIKAGKRPANPEIEKRNAEIYSEYKRLRMVYRADTILKELSEKTGLSEVSIQSIVSRMNKKS